MEDIRKIVEEKRTISPPIYLRDAAHIKDYDLIYQRSVNDPESFWGQIASNFIWEERWDKVLQFTPPRHRWFAGGKTNITINALDRHIVGQRRNKVALLWTSERGQEVVVTYDRLLRRVCQLANALASSGVQKGDRVVICLPNSVEAIYSMLACARLGAIHVVLSTAMGKELLRSRIEDSRPKVVIYADVTYFEGKVIPLKGLIQDAIRGCDSVEKIVVVRRQEPKVELFSSRDVDFLDFINGQPQWINPCIVDADHPLFILYTSGATGKPKGLVHVHGGYMVGAAYFTRVFYDIQDSDIFWNATDISWVVGHTNIVYGPLLNGATVFFREGSLVLPDPHAAWKIIERHGINVLSITPGRLKTLMSSGPKFQADARDPYDLSTLRLVAPVGEPISLDVYNWAREFIAGKNGFVVDSWWQSELAAPVIGSLLAYDSRLDRVGKPLPGVVADVVDEAGKSLSANAPGRLILRRPIPCMVNTIWGSDDRYKKYWDEVPGAFSCGDNAFRDEDGYYYVLGRSDDSITVGGYRITVAEVESIMKAHPYVADVAAVTIKDSGGKKVKICVVLREGFAPSGHLSSLLYDHIQYELGRIATPGEIVFCETIPKAGDGKADREALKRQFLNKESE
ncbi:MAG: acetate--CoA ligase [Chlorobiales bacterium]|nr:acetate--CoA ligase [Chlorobiales bacterium]